MKPLTEARKRQIAKLATHGAAIAACRSCDHAEAARLFASIGICYVPAYALELA